MEKGKRIRSEESVFIGGEITERYVLKYTLKSTPKRDLIFLAKETKGPVIETMQTSLRVLQDSWACVYQLRRCSEIVILFTINESFTSEQ